MHNLNGPEWRKSTRSSADNNCVEVGATWRRSTRSGVNNNCVEVAGLVSAVAVRDSKAPDEVLVFTSDEWRAFIVDAHRGVYDLG